jgi:antitoxin ParD1/3/4
VREEQKARLAALHAALMEGEKSGPSSPFDFDDFIARKHETELPGPHIQASS